jgi:hypothetical protein
MANIRNTGVVGLRVLQENMLSQEIMISILSKGSKKARSRNHCCIFLVCVCSLSYAAFKRMRLLCCYLWPLWLYHIFSMLSHTLRDLGNGGRWGGGGSY